MKNQGAFAIVPVDLFDRGLNPGAMVVFAALASFAGKTRVAWPSLSTLAQMVKMTERSVRRCIGELEAAGAISRVARFDDDGRQTSNAYRLDILMSHFAARADTGVPPEGDVHDREEEDISVPQTVPVGTIPNRARARAVECPGVEGGIRGLVSALPEEGCARAGRKGVREGPARWREPGDPDRRRKALRAPGRSTSTSSTRRRGSTGSAGSTRTSQQRRRPMASSRGGRKASAPRNG